MGLGGAGVTELRDDQLIALARSVIEADGRAVCGVVGAIDDAFVKAARLLSSVTGKVLATGSSLAISALLDALAEIGRVTRGYDWERVFYTHPSGAVGRDAAQTLARLAGPMADD